jgi:hypothetical protein
MREGKPFKAARRKARKSATIDEAKRRRGRCNSHSRVTPGYYLISESNWRKIFINNKNETREDLQVFFFLLIQIFRRRRKRVGASGGGKQLENA